MSKTNELFDDYATEAVPEDKTVSGFRIGMINGNLAFAVPGLLTGLEVGTSLGFQQSVLAFLVGGVLLSLMGFITGWVGQQNRFTSYMLLKFVFGTRGASVISLAFVISLLGWYGVNIDLFSEVTSTFLQNEFDTELPIWLMEVALGLVITLTTIWGFVLLDKLSGYFVPLLAVILCYMLYQTLSWQQPIPPTDYVATALSFGEAVTAVVGSFIVSVVIMPDLSRFARHKMDAAVASVFPFLGLSSFVYLVSALAGVLLGEADVLVVMLTLGLGTFAFILLIVSSWVTNVLNLYSAGLGLKALTPKVEHWVLVVIAGVLGTLVSSINLLDSFTSFLFGLAIIFTPVAAIYSTDFFFIRKQTRYQLSELDTAEPINYSALIAWALGVLFTYTANHYTVSFSGIEAVDACVVTVLCYLGLRRVLQSKVKQLS